MNSNGQQRSSHLLVCKTEFGPFIVGRAQCYLLGSLCEKQAVTFNLLSYLSSTSFIQAHAAQCRMERIPNTAMQQGVRRTYGSVKLTMEGKSADRCWVSLANTMQP